MNALDLHSDVEKLRNMDQDERDAFFQPSATCDRCNQFKTWIAWSLSEPTSLTSFLLDLWDEHQEAAVDW